VRVDGVAAGSALACIFAGNVQVQGNLEVSGDVLLTTGGDIAERFEAESSAACEPGIVMVMGEHGTLVPCNRKCDKRVVGVVSGAGRLRPAITLGADERNVPTASIALIGTVYCRVEADTAPIEIGDLLTTSHISGHATKAVDAGQTFGAIVGKALRCVESGRALIPILLTRH
jgi:hypothetical protein